MNFSEINNKNTVTYQLFCSGSFTPQNYILFALSLTSDVKQEAISECNGSKRITRKMKRNITYINIKLKGRDYAKSPTRRIFDIL